MTAKYSLESVNFAANLSASLTSLLEGSFHCDVTLVCDDGQLSAHKVILAASSSFFSSVFQMNPHNHPLMYLRGVKTDQMQSVLQFLYAGTTAMTEENVSSFLAVAADLRIVGLAGSLDEQQLVLDGQNIAATVPSNEEDSKKNVQFILPEPKQEDINDESLIENQSILVEKRVFITKQLTTPEKVPSLATNQKESGLNPGNTTASDEKIPTVPAILENRPNITMVTNTTPQKTTMSPKTTASPIMRPVLQPKLNMLKPLGERKIVTIAPRTRRKPIHVPSIFCPICQTRDPKSTTIKMHMESKREVQCRACKLYFGNCFSLGKHMKGRCRDKKAREENKVKSDI